HGATFGSVGEHVADEYTVFIVLVARYGVGKARNAGDGTRRDSAFGDLVAFVGLVLGAVRGDELAAVDRWSKVEFLGIDAETAFSQQQIAEHDSRALELVRYVEDFGNELEAVGDIEWCGDDSGVIAKGRPQHLPEIALFGLGGNAGGRTRTLAVDHHDGDFRVSRADGHVDHANFVLDLPNHDVGLAGVLGHPVKDAGRGAHGVGRIELDAGGRAS